MRLLQVASQHLRLPQERRHKRLKDRHVRCSRLCHRLCEQWHGIGDAPDQDVRRPQGRSHLRKHDREVCLLTEAQGPFEPEKGLGQVALAEAQQADAPRGNHEARRVRNRLGNREALVPEGTALRERTELGMGRGEIGTGVHGGQVDQTEALVAPHTLEGRHGLSETVDRSAIGALIVVGEAEMLVRYGVHGDIATGHGQREGTLGSGNRLVMRAHDAEML